MNGSLSIFHVVHSFFSVSEKNLAIDFSLNSLQNVDIFIILNNLHYFVTDDTIDSSKNDNFQTQYLFEPFSQLFSILRSIFF